MSVYSCMTLEIERRSRNFTSIYTRGAHPLIDISYTWLGSRVVDRGVHDLLTVPRFRLSQEYDLILLGLPYLLEHLPLLRVDVRI